jgi:hypothetical protein
MCIIFLLSQSVTSPVRTHPGSAKRMDEECVDQRKKDPDAPLSHHRNSAGGSCCGRAKGTAPTSGSVGAPHDFRAQALVLLLVDRALVERALEIGKLLPL